MAPPGHTDRMSAKFPQHTVVRVSSIRAGRFDGQPIYDVRHPQVGDIGTVLEIYERPELGYEVECSDPKTGASIWLAGMYPDELEAHSPDVG